MIKTWGGRSEFDYDGSVLAGTKIRYGAHLEYSKNVTANGYAALRSFFRGKVIKVGPSRTDPPSGSLGKWLLNHVTQTGIASYVAPILVREGYAIKVNKTSIQIIR